MTEDEKVLREFDVARENRRFEIQMFWQRANYYLVLNTALVVGVFSVENVMLSASISWFGLVAAYLWYQTNLGSKFWQSFWENEVHRLAKILDVTALALENQEIYEDTSSIEAQDDTTTFKKWINRQIRKSPSVSLNMIILSMVTGLGWLLLAGGFTIASVLEVVSDDPYFLFD